VLYGRDVELASLVHLLDEARASRSGVVVVRGEAGVGKSALLDELAANASGMQVLRATGVQTESEVAFAGLHQIIRPLLGHLDEVPTPQAAALRAALGLGPGAEPDQFLISLASLSLLAAGAETQPLLCLVDDAQWLDAASAHALTFAARRLEAEGIALVFAARAPNGGGFDAQGLTELRLEGLESEAAANLLSGPAGTSLAPDVREHLVRATGGNPLALLELPRLLSDDQLAGRELLRDPVPVGETMEAAFLERARTLPRHSQTLLLLAAAEDSGETRIILRAAAALDIEATAFRDAEEAGLVRFGERWVEFRHPLVRSAVYQGASLPERQAVHQTLAQTLDGDEYADLRAWHRAAATNEPDAEVASELEQSADRARLRSGYSAASAAFESAAALSVDEGLRARRLFAAADAAWLAGRPQHATALLEQARNATTDTLLRADIDYLFGSIQFQRGVTSEAYDLLLAAAGNVASANPQRALRTLVAADRAAAFAGDFSKEIQVARRAEELGVELADSFEYSWLVGIGSMLAGDYSKGVTHLRRGIAEAQDFRDPTALSAASELALYLVDIPLADTLLNRTVAAARATGALGNLPYALGLLASAEVNEGKLTAAAANASEGLRLATDTGQQLGVSMALAALARVEAHRGREDACRQAVHDATEIASAHGLATQAASASAALAELDLAAGRPAEAFARLQPLGQAMARHVHPFDIVYGTPDLVEAAVRVGSADVVCPAVNYFEEWVEATKSPWAMALAERCRALLSEGDEAREHFEGATRLHATDGPTLASARTSLLYGEFLRRGRQRREAREHLRAALDRFEQIGAAPWAERARGELRASGETARRRDPSTLDELTRQELQIARFVAEGLTNRQVAEQLFLSPRTIDFHLRNVFRKLDITSRNELGRLISPVEAEPVGAAYGEPSR
jgi:DNA-binding CsgD family transcriptional regulator